MYVYLLHAPMKKKSYLPNHGIIMRLTNSTLFCICRSIRNDIRFVFFFVVVFFICWLWTCRNEERKRRRTKDSNKNVLRFCYLTFVESSEQCKRQILHFKFMKSFAYEDDEEKTNLMCAHLVLGSIFCVSEVRKKKIWNVTMTLSLFKKMSTKNEQKTFCLFT